MAIAFDSSGSAAGNSVTTLTYDITSATVGAVVYAWIYNGTAEASVTNAGWTQLVSADEGVASHYSLWRRVKQSGDTTFSPSWPSNQGSSIVWVSYTGANTSTPEESTASASHTTSSASYATPSATPTAGDRWALTFYAARSTTAGNESFTADAAQTLRLQTVNTLTRWAYTMASDSNAAVTQAAHSYTATLSAAEPHGGTAITFLIPASSAPAYVPAETTQLGGYF